MSSDHRHRPRSLRASRRSRSARGYWASVGRRLLARQGRDRGLRRASCAIVLAAIFAPWLALADPYRGSDAAPAAADRHAGLSARHRRTRPRHAEPPDLWRPAVAAHGTAAGDRSPSSSAPRSASSPAMSAAGSTPAIMRTIDVFFAFPSVLLAIAMSGALGAGILNAIVSLTVVFMPQIDPRRRSGHHPDPQHAISSRRRASSGAGPLTIMRVHVLGNVLGPIFVYATEPDQRVDDPGLGAVVSRPRRPSRRSRNGA